MKWRVNAALRLCPRRDVEECQQSLWVTAAAAEREQKVDYPSADLLLPTRGWTQKHEHLGAINQSSAAGAPRLILMYLMFNFCGDFWFFFSEEVSTRHPGDFWIAGI